MSMSHNEELVKIWLLRFIVKTQNLKFFDEENTIKKAIIRNKYIFLKFIHALMIVKSWILLMQNCNLKILNLWHHKTTWLKGYATLWVQTRHSMSPLSPLCQIWLQYVVTIQFFMNKTTRSLNILKF